jgi:hypothetical protein
MAHPLVQSDVQTPQARVGCLKHNFEKISDPTELIDVLLAAPFAIVYELLKMKALGSHTVK